MSLHDQLAADAANVFLSGSDFAESAIVGDGTVERTIFVIVDRNPPDAVHGNLRKISMRIQVANDPVLGIDPSAFNAGKYYLKLGRDLGDAAERIRLHAKPVRQDAGMLTFEI